MTFSPRVVYGVDFSGAAQAGENTWVSQLVPHRRRWRVAWVERLSDVAGAADRTTALGHLVSMIRASDAALWGMDFPFGLPIEIFPAGTTWLDQLRIVAGYPSGAADFGRWCVDQALRLGPKLHIRRATDTEARTPFDCYHYRIIYQTFHGMRDVLAPLAGTRGTVVVPFQLNRLSRARRVIVESCPGSTLKQWGLPHQNYKQATGGPLTAIRRRTRRRIIEGLLERVAISERDVRRLMRNPGGDALDAVIAGVGAVEAWARFDLRQVRRHPRYPLEGLVLF